LIVLSVENAWTSNLTEHILALLTYWQWLFHQKFWISNVLLSWPIRCLDLHLCSWNLVHI
jgi:hypothetical protein